MHWLISSLVFIDVSTSVCTGTTEEILIMVNDTLAINGRLAVVAGTLVVGTLF